MQPFVLRHTRTRTRTEKNHETAREVMKIITSTFVDDRLDKKKKEKKNRVRKRRRQKK